MLKYFGIAFLAHVVFLVFLMYFDPAVSWTSTHVVLFYYLWPLFVLPSSGGSHGGELVVAVFSIPINSLIWAYVLWTFKRIRSAPQPS